MKFGIVFANTGFAATPEGAASLGRIAEEAGFESLWTVEHVIVPAGYESQYPYSPTGKMPGNEDNPIPDPLIWLTWVAANTRTINLATGILILPQRNPIVLSKEVATLDVLSSGRAILGVGVGWLREEFDAIGVDFDDRGPITDEYIEALRELWRADEPTFNGRWTSFERAKMYPKPAQSGGVPIHVGGHSKAAAKRAGRLGDGFFPAKGSLEELASLFGVARTAATEAGRDPSAIEMTCGGAMDVEGVKKYADIGADRLVVPAFGRDAESYKQMLGGFGENVISKL
ncbi:MAG TPA: LLM class F420-dependent oxidoreductase [Acidimicrobiales bacterium]|nr:LLM class F420-dependent oxidoreductase [Acidimicrobiales bacterium]